MSWVIRHRDRTVTPSELRLVETIGMEPINCSRCHHVRDLHSSNVDLGCCNIKCECWEFTTDPNDRGNWTRSEAITPDLVNHPPHYTNHPSGVECIQVTEHLNFCIGNAVKYLWRIDDKGDPVENLEKAKWYIEREIARRKGQSES